MHLEQRLAMLRLVLERKGTASLVMRGRSMLPTLREGMNLQIHRRNIRLGDIAVFPYAGELLIHRIVSIDKDVVLTAGDAQPGRLERITPGDVTGVLCAAGGKRLRAQGAGAYLRGMWFVGARALRARDPRRRARVFTTLWRIVAKGQTADSAALRAELVSVETHDLLQCAARHGVVGFLAALADRISDLPPGLRGRLSRARLRIHARRQYLRRQIDEVTRILDAAEIPFALLKGAARMYAGVDEADLHDACDIDILVPVRMLPRAIRIFLEHGYAQPAAERYGRYYEEHHHTAPLVPQRGLPIELHTRLAPFSVASGFAEFEQLISYLRPLGESIKHGYVLDDMAAAFHAAVHGRGIGRLRDVIVLSRLLERMCLADRTALAEMISQYCPGVEVQATFALGALLARGVMPADARTAAYLDWAFRREELPAVLRARAQVIDAMMARVPMRAALRRIVPREAGADHLPGRMHRMLRAVARGALAPLVALYALRLGRSRVAVDESEIGEFKNDAGDIVVRVG